MPLVDIPLSIAGQYSKIVNDVFVGVGALLAGFGGLKIALDWVNDKKRKNRLREKVSKLRKQYPYSLFNQDGGYEIYKMKDYDQWWLIDKKANTRRWIRNPQTVKDMGWRGEPGIPKEIEKGELKKYSRKEPPIDTTTI